MKVVVLKTHLKEGLEAAGRVSAKSSTLPILSNVLLSANKEEIQLSATDLQMGITYKFLGKVEREGSAVFPGHFLGSLLAVSLGEQVSLALEGHSLAVAVGEHQAVLKTFDEEEFPIIPSLEGSEPSLQIETELFCQGLNQVAGMTGQSQARPEISGVLFAVEKKELRVVATDSFRLAERKLGVQRESSEARRFILPLKTARELIAVLGDRPGRTTMYFSPTQAVFDYEAPEDPSGLRVRIVSRLIEGEYPHYEDVIPSAWKTLVRSDKSEFLGHLKAAGIFAGKTQEIRVRVEPEKKEVRCLAENPEAGSHQSAFQGEITGEAVEAAFNWRFLVEGLAHIRGDKIEFGMNGSDGPALLRSADQEGYVYVIMPIRA